MTPPFVATTKVQRQTSAVFGSDDPFQIVLSNNETAGMIVNKNMTEMLIKSGILEQLAEEMWELQNQETAQTVLAARTGNDEDSVEYSSFREQYEL